MIKKFNEFNNVNESSVDLDFEDEVINTKSYSKLSDSMSKCIQEFHEDLRNEIGYEEGDTDKDRAVSNAIQKEINFQEHKL